MASQMTSDSLDRVTAPSSSEDERPVEPVWLDVSTVKEILQHIVDSRRSGSESTFAFHWQPTQVYDLSDQLDAGLAELGQPKVRRFEYDFKSGTVYLDVMSESVLHFMVQIGLHDHFKYIIARLLATADEPIIRDSLQSVVDRGTASLNIDDKILTQPDAETRPHVEEKARKYIDLSDNKIQVVLILDLQRPGIKKAWVSLLVVDDSSSHWIRQHELFHDDNLDQQPVGHIDLYLSDFVGIAGLPAIYCRPSTAELTAGITRNPIATLTYEQLRAIFRRARHCHNPTEFTTEVGDKEENPYEEAERRVVEVRNKERLESERRLAEEWIKADRRLAEVEWQVADLKRRVAGFEQQCRGPK
ncbi:uncharacterized protein B0T15DRAFT_545205 [Chaetomium strumarium]|uniref:Uncharacterized protein n=1 Tax=Chaetomium strumarium TaxID=1170767 RepID=A0AAJ0H092_9PEZI|nr:hypothetical protein B0T15DRAFT_545205 [Chaetomium strumarium]